MVVFEKIIIKRKIVIMLKTNLFNRNRDPSYYPVINNFLRYCETARKLVT